MFKNGSLGWKSVWRCLVIVFLVAACPLWANDRERQGRQRRERPRRENSQNRRDNGRPEKPKHQLSEEGTAGVLEIQEVLKEVLETVNQNRRPEQEMLEKGQQLLVDNKRHAQNYDTDQRAAYMLLQAWTSYYQDDLSAAMNWAIRAGKTDETSRDAWISSAVFCMLNDKRPKLPQTKKTSQRRPRRGRDDFDMAEMSGATSDSDMRKGTLEFDVLALRQEIFSERFKQIDYQKEWGEEINYESGKDTLCLLFWQSEKANAEDAISDANDIGQTAARRKMPDDIGMMAMRARSHQSPKLGLKEQRDYFKHLAWTCREQASLKFVQVNTDLPEQVKIIAPEELNEEQMSKEMSAGTYVPLIFAARNLDPKEYAGLNAAGPFMLVVSSEGKLKYAGPAADFVPAFILTAVTGVEIDLQKMTPAKTDSAARSGFNGDLRGIPRGRLIEPVMRSPVRPSKPVADPNKPAAVDPNVPAVLQEAFSAKPAEATPATVTAKPSQKNELSLEDQNRAENLLREAQLHIDASRKIRGKSPEKGIEACREILEKYPNTEYAGKAQGWLRRVRPDHKKKYKITNEELGY